ncbi:recombinase family protein [Acetobacterium wieringae]|uniref:recombinase family protein n=1 Tax=Acetobacterium wieringae TaxID=52694 RepID=UPI003158694F
MSNKKAALYIRVSTAMQADRDSLPLQRSDLANYAKLVLNIDDYEIFEDAGFSAKNTDRPKYQEMMARVRSREFSHILVWKIDRISRNLIDFCEMYEEIKKYDTAFISKNEQFDTSSAMGEAMLKIILVFAELERKLTGERVLSVMIDRASKGMWNGARPPLGFDMSADLDYPVVNEEEADLVRFIFDLYEDLRSSAKVSRYLQEHGYKTKRGGNWGSKVVTDILHNPFYIGTYRYNYRESARGKKKNENEWVEVEDNHPAIIDKDQFRRVQNIIDSNFKGNSQSHRNNWKTHIFSKIVFCEHCGRIYVSNTGLLRADGITPSRYYCTGVASGGKCTGTIGDVTLVPFIFNYLLNYCNLTERITEKMRFSTIEKILLNGPYFINVESIEASAIEAIKEYLCHRPNIEIYQNPECFARRITPPKNQVQDEIKKFETALNRLNELYLFSEESMSQKEYILKKKEFESKLADLKSEDKNSVNEPEIQSSINHEMYLKNIVMLKALFESKFPVTHEGLMKNIGTEMLYQIVHDLILKITVKNNMVQSIIFKNGIVHRFNYKMNSSSRIISNVDLFLYANRDKIINYVEKHGTIDRKTIREITGAGSTESETAIRSLLRKKEIILIKDGKNKRYTLPKAQN